MWENSPLMDSIFKFADWMLVGWEVRRRKMILHRNLSLVLKIVKGIIWLIHKCCPKSHYFGNDLMLCGWRLGAASPLTCPGAMPLMQQHQTAATSFNLLALPLSPDPRWRESQFLETFLCLSLWLLSIVSAISKPRYHLLIVSSSTGEA